MEILQTVAAAIVTLGILVTIHEYGHFWVARRCGVKVLRFSVGFGKPLYRWYDRQQTEYVIAAIPLGGYVKMLDEREDDVPPELRSQAFNTKPVGQRIAIVAAGPVVNLVFAVFAYWLMFVAGINTVVPVIGELKPESVAMQAGLQSGRELIAVDGHQTRTWEEVSLRLAARIGDSGELRLRTRELNGTNERELSLPIQRWQFDEQHGPLFTLGIEPYRPQIPATIGSLVEGGRAQQGGLQVGDRVLMVDDQSIERWEQLVEQIRNRPEQQVRLQLERQGRVLELALTPARTQAEDGQAYGYIGAGVQQVSWPPEMMREVRFSVIEAVPAAVAKSGQMIGLTLESIWKMLQGLISVKNLSGPITIAKVAGASAASGLESFLNFLAYLSISLGILNLLPIPVLDGGHLLYYLVEAVRGKPVSEKTQILGLKIGMSLLLGLMLLALYNDVLRL
ncbi:sigma E protease regulator RseP [Motiliproteus coralliicola]|uniref:Zinc metalloprotease n=1 Tax=Motiliproteus coralliicola TaxID=2283196 RepID=A0A369W948_9GAMM|nr:sigma E protease regulator RseP [Motiliproteus coralliicola]RDE18518.1 sigma E protease regulator RseP [Motiliproteus coralliicola]